MIRDTYCTNSDFIVQTNRIDYMLNHCTIKLQETRTKSENDT